jgi:hypothetical protein
MSVLTPVESSSQLFLQNIDHETLLIPCGIGWHRRQCSCHRLSGYARGRGEATWMTPAAHRSTHLPLQPAPAGKIPDSARGYGQLKSAEKLALRGLHNPNIAPTCNLGRLPMAPALGVLHLPFSAVVRAADATAAPFTLHCFQNKLYPPDIPCQPPRPEQEFCTFAGCLLTFFHYQASHCCDGEARTLV